MKEKTVFKIIVDVIMTILYLFLMFSFGTGAFFHEVAGILTGILFILHVVLNLDFFRGLLKAFKKGSMKPDRKLLLISDDLLIIFMPVALITGLLIAKEIYMLNWPLDFLLIFKIHKISSYVCLGLLALHLVLHGKYLVGVFRQMGKKKNKKVLMKVMSRCSAAIFTVFFAYMLTYNAYSKSKTAADLPLSEETSAVSSNNTTDAVETSSEQATTVVSQSENNSVETEDQSAAQTTPSTTKKKDEDSTQTTQNTTTAATVPSLSDFLGKMFCTGCSRHCVLTSPQCSRGVMQAEQAEQEYVEQYGTSN